MLHSCSLLPKLIPNISNFIFTVCIKIVLEMGRPEDKAIYTLASILLSTGDFCK